MIGDETFDFVVPDYGFAGAVAAIEAADQGGACVGVVRPVVSNTQCGPVQTRASACSIPSAKRSQGSMSLANWAAFGLWAA